MIVTQLLNIVLLKLQESFAKHNESFAPLPILLPTTYYYISISLS
mgnify:CR=1 FL=1